MTDGNESSSTNEPAEINRQLLTKIAALEYVMICVCYTHPNREDLGQQIGDLYEYLKGNDVQRGDRIAELVENLTGFQRPEGHDAP